MSSWKIRLTSKQRRILRTISLRKKSDQRQVRALVGKGDRTITINLRKIALNDVVVLICAMALASDAMGYSVGDRRTRSAFADKLHVLGKFLALSAIDRLALLST